MHLEAANASPARISLAQAIANVETHIARMSAPLPRFNPLRLFITHTAIKAAPGYALALGARHGVVRVDCKFRFGTRRMAAND